MTSKAEVESARCAALAASATASAASAKYHALEAQLLADRADKTLKEIHATKDDGL